jgi:hypothetical protein
MKFTIGSEKTTTAGRGCLTLFLGVFGAMGLLFTGLLVKPAFDTIRTYSWDQAECTILESTVREKGEHYDLEVRYTYRAKGRSHTGTRFRVGMQANLDAADAERARVRYAPGNQATCLVNPSNPTESVLERGSLWFLFILPLPLLFVTIGVGGIIGVWRSKPADEKSGQEKPVSERHRSAKSAGPVLRVLGAIFALVGAGLLFVMLIRPMIREFAARSWARVPCQILSSRVTSHSGSKGGSTYSIDVRYRYEVGGREYTGTRYNFETGSSSSRKWRAAAVKEYPPGRKTVCLVNPEDPFDAVLSTAASPDRWFGLLPGLFLLAGLFLFFKVAPKAGENAMPGARAASGVPAPLRSDSAGPAQLKPSVAPMTGCAIIWGVALFWNGIVWAILINMGKGEWFGRIFLSLFALIGAGLAALAIYQFLALFNPRPILTASSLLIPLGGTLEVSWRFVGSVRRLRRLTLGLAAREEATYRRGTTTTTDRNVFLNLQIFETTDRAQMAQGTTTVQIPAGVMHTFSASNNKIVWTLLIDGDIPRWPNVSLEFPVTVLPAEPVAPVETEPSGT